MSLWFITFFRYEGSNFLLLLIYVDYIILMGNSPSSMQKVNSHLSTVFYMKNLGNLHYFPEIWLGRYQACVKSHCLWFSGIYSWRWYVSRSRSLSSNGWVTPVLDYNSPWHCLRCSCCKPIYAIASYSSSCCCQEDFLLLKGNSNSLLAFYSKPSYCSHWVLWCRQGWLPQWPSLYYRLFHLHGSESSIMGCKETGHCITLHG